ncbi:MAG: hypothetical protein ACPLKQ_01390 [Candidatus Bathyarchaeales archaeon]
MPFNTGIPDNMVRLVTEELAVSIARRHMSEFGSNTQVLGCQITKTSETKPMLGWKLLRRAFQLFNGTSLWRQKQEITLQCR